MNCTKYIVPAYRVSIEELRCKKYVLLQVELYHYAYDTKQSTSHRVYPRDLISRMPLGYLELSEGRALR